MTSDVAMRVGLLSASVSRRAGGLFEAMRGLAGCVAVNGDAEVLAFGLEDHDFTADLVPWDGTRVSACSVWGARVIGYAPALLPTVMAANLDVLHVHGLWKYPSIVSLRWSVRTRKPVVISPHGMLEPWAMQQARWKKRIALWLYEKRHLRSAACLQALCTSEAETLRQVGFRNPIGIIPNGVDLPSESSDGPPSWQEVVPEDAGILLYLGRLHPKKNVDGLLRGWARLSRTHASDWWLVIAGWDEGGHEAELRELVRALAIPRVIFVGPQFGAEKSASFRRADALVLTSHSEGLPVAVLEALAYSLPVVITPECNVPEAAKAGAAILVDRDPERIAEGIAALIHRREFDRQVMGQAGRRLVEEQFSWPVIGRRVLAMYRWVLGQVERPDWVTVE